MRIADVLRERDDGEDDISGDNSLPSFKSKNHYASPNAVAGSCSRSLLSRLFRHRRKNAPAASGGERFVSRSSAAEIVTGTVDSGGRLPEFDFSSGARLNEIAFNLGMGIGMALVLAGNAKEMNKMEELRKQMETLLKDINGGVERREDGSLYTLSDVVGEDAISSSLDMEEPKHFIESDRRDYQSVNSLRAMDQLEEELQVELELMELNFEGGDGGKHNEMELNGEKVDSSSGSSAPAWYDRMPDESGEEEHGVCAYDLQRRLHELLQTRQQERIEALESSLEAAQRELNEKEDELCYWKKKKKKNNGRGLIPENDENYFSLSFK